jgi:hypothetical protein
MLLKSGAGEIPSVSPIPSSRLLDTLHSERVAGPFLPLHLSLKAKGVNPIQRCNTSPILIFKRKLE